MNARRWMFAIIVVAVGFGLGRLARAGGGAGKDPTSLQGKPAPAFAMETLDGKQVDLASEKGNVVLVDFWASWCGPCKASLPHVQKLSADKELAAKGLKVWAVNAHEAKDKVAGFIKENTYSFQVPLDADGATMKNYMVQGIPTTVIIGRDGTVKKVFIGFGGEESAKQIDEAINEALAEPAPGKSS